MGFARKPALSESMTAGKRSGAAAGFREGTAELAGLLIFSSHQLLWLFEVGGLWRPCTMLAPEVADRAAHDPRAAPWDP